MPLQRGLHQSKETFFLACQGVGGATSRRGLWVSTWTNPNLFRYSTLSRISAAQVQCAVQCTRTLHHHRSSQRDKEMIFPDANFQTSSPSIADVRFPLLKIAASVTHERFLPKNKNSHSLHCGRPKLKTNSFLLPFI